MFSAAIQDYPFYALLALSFFVSFRVLNFPDLALDSAYGAGMATLVRVVNVNAVTAPVTLSLLAGAGVGFMIGAILGGLYVIPRVGLNKLLAGLVVSFAVYAFNFRLNLYSVTQGLYTRRHEFNFLRTLDTPIGSGWLLCFVTVGVLVVVLVLVTALLRGRTGLYLRVAGFRPHLLIESGRRAPLYVICGLGLADSLAGAAGVLRAATDNYADINTFGTFLVALAGLLVGERILHGFRWYRRRAQRVMVAVLCPLLGGLVMSFLIQGSLVALTVGSGNYYAADIKLVVSLAVLASCVGLRRRDALMPDGTDYA